MTIEMSGALLDAAGRVERHKQGRRQTALSLDVISVTPSDNDDYSPALPGTLTLFVAPKESVELKRLRRAYFERDRKYLSELTANLDAERRARKPLSEESLADALIAADAIADVYYASKLLQPNITLIEDRRLELISFPFTGGEIDDSRLTAKQFLLGETSHPLDMLVVKHFPVLSAAELDALRLVPAELRDMNVDPYAHVMATPATLIVATIAATAMHTPFLGIVASIADLRSKLKDTSIASDRIRNIGPAASVRELLAARAAVLRGGVDQG